MPVNHLADDIALGTPNLVSQSMSNIYLTEDSIDLSSQRCLKWKWLSP